MAAWPPSRCATAFEPCPSWQCDGAQRGRPTQAWVLMAPYPLSFPHTISFEPTTAILTTNHHAPCSRRTVLQERFESSSCCTRIPAGALPFAHQLPHEARPLPTFFPFSTHPAYPPPHLTATQRLHLHLVLLGNASVILHLPRCSCACVRYCPPPSPCVWPQLFRPCPPCYLTWERLMLL